MVQCTACPRPRGWTWSSWRTSTRLNLWERPRWCRRRRRRRVWYPNPARRPNRPLWSFSPSFSHLWYQIINSTLIQYDSENTKSTHFMCYRSIPLNRTGKCTRTSVVVVMMFNLRNMYSAAIAIKRILLTLFYIVILWIPRRKLIFIGISLTWYFDLEKLIDLQTVVLWV